MFLFLEVKNICKHTQKQRDKYKELSYIHFQVQQLHQDFGTLVYQSLFKMFSYIRHSDSVKMYQNLKLYFHLSLSFLAFWLRNFKAKPYIL